MKLQNKSEKVSNRDSYFSPVIITTNFHVHIYIPSPSSPLLSFTPCAHSTDSAILVFSSLFFIAFCSHSSLVIINFLPQFLLFFTHFPLSNSFLSAFLDSLVCLHFLYVSFPPFLVYLSLFILVVYIIFDTPSIPTGYSESLYSFDQIYS
jgi:hypothetical protein